MRSKQNRGRKNEKVSGYHDVTAWGGIGQMMVEGEDNAEASAMAASEPGI